MSDVSAIRTRWASAEGSLTPCVSSHHDDTDLEYRGAHGKWTLATVYGDGTDVRAEWVDRFRNAADDTRTLLAETTALTERAERAERELDELRAESAAYRAERDQMRRWAEAAAADENANAEELREARATLDAIAALVGPGDVVERVRALTLSPGPHLYSTSQTTPWKNP